MKKIAIITGASSGMGQRFCYEIDKLGMDEIWGVALKTDEVEKMKTELKTPFKFYSLDLTKDESFTILETELKKEKDLSVEWVVNASGYGKFGRYDDTTIEAQIGMVDLNCKALTHLTLLALQFMKEGGRIVEFGSIAAFQPIPYIAVYGATKAYVLSYSRALNRELKSRKISVTCLCPYWTKTPFFDRATDVKTKETVIKKYAAMYDPNKVVKRGIKGALKRKEVVLYGFIAKAQTALVKILPHKWVMSIWERQQKFKKTYKGR
ncbi:MAG: SDR family NAD(P)-dependent oxidoreductase [Clostridia bacterium]|nr:SDR family NAD(P)-dependent oxidoreductase [Clostridia bacterium]